jgi:hypothetical protein
MSRPNEDSLPPAPTARIAIVLTVGLFLLGGVYVFLNVGPNPKPLPLNQLGDFLGGMGSALAFIWIIQAYRQTQHELRLTRREIWRTVPRTCCGSDNKKFRRKLRPELRRRPIGEL